MKTHLKAIATVAIAVALILALCLAPDVMFWFIVGLGLGVLYLGALSVFMSDDNEPE